MMFNAETNGIDVVKHFHDQVKGKIFALTGPSAGGIGAEAAISLAYGAPTLILLLGRSAERVQTVIEAIRAVDASVPVKFVQVDLSSLASVRAAAKAILADHDVPRIDVLINNAGIMAAPFSLSVDGIESQFAAGHVGHFLLTNLLMPKLRAAEGETRVVNVSSLANRMGPVRFDDPNFTEPGSYTPFGAYGQVKRANVLFTVALNERLANGGGGGIRAYSLHPGSIPTNLQAHTNPEMLAEARETLKEFERQLSMIKTTQQGCSTHLRAALDPDLPKEDGVYLSDCVLTTDPSELDQASLVPGDAEKLWTLSEKLVGQEFKY
ncbi:hypothetical protein RB595_004812 [Gaeumannomyces hyphopodioides]